MKSELLAFSRSQGFEECRVAPANDAPHGDYFREWLAEGRAGEMAWLGRDPDRRVSPQRVLPGARSVIILAKNYYQGRAKIEGRGTKAEREESKVLGRPTKAGSQESNGAGGGTQPHVARDIGASACDDPATGRIARYAWGDDYHALLEGKLRAIDGWLASRGGRQRCYVDTGPVLERDFAALAGIGWHGKSTMLIHPQLGTWFFLCTILTTLSLEPDGAVPNRCGRCTRCIDVCPTRAIVGDHQLDARRCISYLTIELKGSIPEEFRPLIGSRIFGCDDCLDACPWNRFAQASRESAFGARDEVVDAPLRDFLSLDETHFRALFRDSPIKRIKRRGFLRNVCVALGNVGTSADLPALEGAARDDEPLIAEHARWAIAQIQVRESASHRS